MQKTKTFKETRFSADVLHELISAFDETASKTECNWSINTLRVDHPDSQWSYDTLEEFLADYRLYSGSALLDIRGSGLVLHMQVNPRETYLSLTAFDRPSIEYIFRVLERSASEHKLPPLPTIKIKPSVFIGHGRSPLWRELKDHLQDKHDITVNAYETGARAGHTIRDVLEEMADNSSFALLIMTAEDEQADGALRARQNVVHEAGLFQGKLGFPRAIMVMEEGVEEFSNVQGVQQIRFSRGNIKETFGEVLATLRREFNDEK